MTWLRYDLDTADHPSLYASLAGTAAMLLHGRAADDVFFVHTPLGVRLRCRAGQPNTADVAWQAALSEARGRGWLTAWRSAPYEPEAFGLGGADAMAAAHRVFTADSLAWLEFHARAARPVPTVARWAASLLMVRSLVDGLGLAPWETDDLWDRVGRNTRRLHHAGATDPAVRHLTNALRAGWDEPDILRDRLDAHQNALVATYDTAVRPAAAAWRAVSTPALRHGVALAVLFHWNRAAMPVAHQQLLAASRPCHQWRLAA
jgi:thiopeptide-type bacteriocin biosynthesis protein